MIAFTIIALIACVLNIYFTFALKSNGFGALGWFCAALLTLADLLEMLEGGL